MLQMTLFIVSLSGVMFLLGTQVERRRWKQRCEDALVALEALKDTQARTKQACLDALTTVNSLRRQIAAKQFQESSQTQPQE